MLYLNLSLPPTTNHRLLATKSGALVKAPKYRQWMEREAECVRRDLPENFTPFAKPLFSLVLVTFPDRRYRDLDNVLKGVNDVLVRGHALIDDHIIQTQVVHRVPITPSHSSQVEVYLWDMEEPASKRWMAVLEESICG